MPLVSIIIPLYNHERFIKETLNSALTQTVQDFEIIVIDDGSTDNSGKLVQEVKDKRIQYLNQDNKGAHNTINRGLGIAQGRYVSILNSDDVYLDNRLEKCLKILENDLAVDAVFSGIEYIDESGQTLKTTSGAEENWSHLDSEPSYKTENNVTIDLLAGNFLKTTSNLFCRKKCIDSVGHFRNLRYCHDYDYFLRLSQRCALYIVKEPLLRYRTHAANTLRENQAAVDLECALVIADFLTMHDLNSFIDTKDPYTLSKIFNSINAHRADRVLSTLLLFFTCLKPRESILDMLTDNHEHHFWSLGRSYLSHYHDGWQAREKILDDWNYLHSQYLECSRELEELKESLPRKNESLVSKSINKLRRIITWGK